MRTIIFAILFGAAAFAQTSQPCPPGTRRFWASQNPVDPYNGCLTAGQAYMWGYSTAAFSQPTQPARMPGYLSNPSSAPPGYYLAGGQQYYSSAQVPAPASSTPPQPYAQNQGCPPGTRRYWASQNPIDPFNGCLTPGQAKMWGYSTAQFSQPVQQTQVPNFGSPNQAPPGYYLPGGQQYYNNQSVQTPAAQQTYVPPATMPRRFDPYSQSGMPAIPQVSLPPRPPQTQP